uniref:Peptidase_M13 domain-containing protein n=1 Tax=Strongyloides venezuelensis TaxID=75913 RepID=A0A0K0G680_STRVS
MDNKDELILTSESIENFRKKLNVLLNNTNFTSEQLFFISIGRIFFEHKRKEHLEKQINDYHTPAEIHTNLALSNYKPFSNAFNCKLHSKINPEHKYEVWKK